MLLSHPLGSRADITAGVIDTFRALSRHPHPSRHERATGEDYMAFLTGLGLTPVRDEAGNIMAHCPATPGREGEPLLILQGHMDMVCAVSPGSGFDPLADPVTILEQDGYLCTDRRSSLGADNGLGNAAALWVLSRGVRHGPLRLIFTVEEEIGLEGAKAVDPAWLAGAAYLLNTDGFHLGRAIVGSAGGRRERWARPLETCPARSGEAWRLSLTGGTGGHSGDDIHLGRINPIKVLAAYLKDRPALAVADFTGGSAFNAIPSGAEVVVMGQKPDLSGLEDALLPFRATDPNLKLDLSPAPRPEAVWRPDFCRDVLGLLAALGHGVYGMDPQFPGVVGASANLGVARREEDSFAVRLFLRSARQADEALMAAENRALAEGAGFSLSVTGYPGWPGDKNNPLAQALDRVYRVQTGRGLEVSAVHVGLEPAVFRAKAPELVMASAGPDILDAHSVDERAPLEGLADYALLLAGLLEEGLS